ncbi:MAG: hypothetical protein ACO1RX_18005 [Candidatus Sericytochromatia bacterium]
MNDGFQLQIEAHPETHLLQTLRLGPHRAVQVLELFQQYYLLERRQGERQTPIQLDEAPLVARLQAGERLLPSEIEGLLPPLKGVDVLLDDQAPAADPLQQRIQSAMARFAAQNPDTAEALDRHRAAAQQAYAEHPALGARPKTGEAAAAGPLPAGEKAVLQEEQFPVPGAQLAQLSAPWVQQSLQQASDNQQQRLEQARQLKTEVEQQSGRVRQSLERLPAFQQQLEALTERLEGWQSEMERHHFQRDSLLSRTAEELAALQEQLRQVLSQGLALQKIVREHRFGDDAVMAERLACFEDMIDHVVQQRHWVHYLQQQQAFRDLEQRRARQLVARRQGLLDEMASLQLAIGNLEQINREVLSQDPLAVPEPVPAVALHELSRLEYELQLLEADPALHLLEENP